MPNGHSNGPSYHHWSLSVPSSKNWQNPWHIKKSWSITMSRKQFDNKYQRQALIATLCINLSQFLLFCMKGIPPFPSTETNHLCGFNYNCFVGIKGNPKQISATELNTSWRSMLMRIMVDCRDQLISIPRAQSVQYYADARPHSNFLTTIHIIIITIIFNPYHHYHNHLQSS